MLKYGTILSRKMPFADATVRDLHHQKHINEFNPRFASGLEYEQAVDAFMAGPAVAPARECFRPNGDKVRFNRRNGYFAVQAPNGNLKTFHRPSEKFIAFGYFQWECGRTV